MGKKLFIILLFVFVAVIDYTRASNTVTIGSVSGPPGDTVTVSVTLDNTDCISAMQLQIPMPENCSLVEGSAANCTRTLSHSTTAGVKEGVLNLLVYSSTMAEISGNSGEVMTFKLKLGNQPSATMLAPVKLILTDTGGNVVEGTAESGSVTVTAAKAVYSVDTIDFGRVPIRGIYTKELTIRNVGNAPLTVTNLIFSATEFTSTAVTPLTIEAGASKTISLQYAPIERGETSQELKVICNSSSKLNTIGLKATPYAVNELHIDDASGIADSTIDIHLRMNNMDAINGFQFEFAMPMQLKYVDGSFTLSERKMDHQCIASLTNDTLRVIAYSPSNKAFIGNDGELASFKVRLEGQSGTNLLPYKAILTATIDGITQDVLSDKYSGYVTILSPVLSAPSSLDMGSTPITEDATSMLSIRNYGSAPLIISRIVFDATQFSVEDSLPITIPPYESKEIKVVYKGQDQSDYQTTMQLYCNDPDKRVWDVVVSGNRYAPNFLTISAPNIYIGDSLNVHFSLDNYDPINGIQFDLSYPKEYFEPTDDIVATDRTTGLSMQMRNLSDGTCRYFFYSLSDSAIASGTGKIFTLTFTPKKDIPLGIYQIHATGIKLGTPNMEEKYSGEDIDVAFKVIEIVDQTVSWTQKTDSMYVGDSFTFEATSSASLPVTYIVTNGTGLVETNVEDGKLIVIAQMSGEVTITAYAEGDESHNPSDSIECSFIIMKNDQTISWQQSESIYENSPVVLNAVASSGLPVSYEIFDLFDGNGILTNDGDTFLLTATGPVGEHIYVIARQEGNFEYNAAPEIEKEFVIINTTEGINSIYASDDDKFTAWYTVNGTKMSSRPTNPGLYIQVKDGKATKVFIK